MPKRNIEFLPDCYYHFYNRGNRKSDIFLSNENYKYCIRLINKYSRELNLSIIAFCLMPNHYHFLIHQNCEIKAGLLPQRVFNCYSKAFNKMHQNKGTLFQGSYKVIQIFKTNHLLLLCRYIHANPVLAGLVDTPEKWPFSDYGKWIVHEDDKSQNSFFDEYIYNTKDYVEFVGNYISNRQRFVKGNIDLLLEN